MNNEENIVGKVTPNTIIHGDCLEILPYIGTASIDAVICDPPYG